MGEEATALFHPSQFHSPRPHLHNNPDEMSEQAGEASPSKVFRRSDHNKHKCKSARMSNIQFQQLSHDSIGCARSAEGQLDVVSEVVSQSSCANPLTC